MENTKFKKVVSIGLLLALCNFSFPLKTYAGYRPYNKFVLKTSVSASNITTPDAIKEAESVRNNYLSDNNAYLFTKRLFGVGVIGTGLTAGYFGVKGNNKKSIQDLGFALAGIIGLDRVLNLKDGLNTRQQAAEAVQCAIDVTLKYDITPAEKAALDLKINNLNQKISNIDAPKANLEADLKKLKTLKARFNNEIALSKESKIVKDSALLTKQGISKGDSNEKIEKKVTEERQENLNDFKNFSENINEAIDEEIAKAEALIEKANNETEKSTTAYNNGVELYNYIMKAGPNLISAINNINITLGQKLIDKEEDLSALKAYIDSIYPKSDKKEEGKTPEKESEEEKKTPSTTDASKNLKNTGANTSLDLGNLIDTSTGREVTFVEALNIDPNILSGEKFKITLVKIYQHMEMINNSTLKADLNALSQAKTAVLHDIKLYSPEKKDVNSCNTDFKNETL